VIRWLGAVLLVLVAGNLAAQDSVPPVDQGVRVGIEYTPGIRPRLVVFPGPGLDSARSILWYFPARDSTQPARFCSVIWITAIGSS